MTATNDKGDIAKLWKMVKHIKIAMLTTQESDGSLRSRPMHSHQVDDDGDIWFFTKASDHKSFEIRQHHQVNLAYAEPDDQNYVSVSGTAELVRDRSRIEAMWSEPLRAWFPRGTDDPDVALIRVRPDYAEYWDSPSSTLVHLYGYAKAVVTGDSPKPGDNAKIDLGRAPR
ncbi:MAG TPA: pyridoxamine 5'-phosphate oxidase family protein [Alphaproteobacteria bacterium]|nr:pyridoxamine 5'-phosphate oxidase family protein [Alphaproteobacteria bacterium]